MGHDLRQRPPITFPVLPIGTIRAQRREDAGELVTGRWQERAACRAPGMDPELFFPISGVGLDLKQVAAAKQVCGRCQVRGSCLESALRHGEPEGIWGGSTPDERRVLRAQPRHSAASGQQPA